jgi:predicted GNAT family acetyltransferase
MRVVAGAERLQSFLRVSAANGRTVVRTPPFTAFLDPGDPLRFLNYAIPDGDVRPELEAVERLRDVFRRHDRLPRLEWVEEAAPRVAEVLAEAGMTQELRTPLMTCAPAELVDATAAVDALAVSAPAPAELRALTDLQRVAFGQERLAGDEEPSDHARHGGGAVLARAGHEPVAAAGWTAVIDGVSEIAGVATAEPWRGRRLAGVVTAAAARAAFAAGATLCVLSPGDDAAQRVYARAGFTRAATMLHWSD